MNEIVAVTTAIAEGVTNLKGVTVTTPEDLVTVTCMTAAEVTRARPGQEPEQTCLEIMLVCSELGWTHRRA